MDLNLARFNIQTEATLKWQIRLDHLATTFRLLKRTYGYLLACGFVVHLYVLSDLFELGSLAMEARMSSSSKRRWFSYLCKDKDTMIHTSSVACNTVGRMSSKDRTTQWPLKNWKTPSSAWQGTHTNKRLFLAIILISSLIKPLHEFTVWSENF